MDYNKLCKENEDLRRQVKRISDQFNDYIMRKKEFERLEKELESCREQIAKFEAKDKVNEQTIKYLRKQLLKKTRQLEAQKKAVSFLRGNNAKPKTEAGNSSS